MTYGKIDLEKLADENQRVNSKSRFLEQFVPMPSGAGTVTVRIMPPVNGGKLFQANRIHSINGRKIHCRRPLVIGKWDRTVCCPICEYYTSLWKQADKLENEGKTSEAERVKQEARQLKPLERYYYNGIIRTMVDKDGVTSRNVGPRVFSVGKIVHGKIIKAMIGGPGETIGDVTNVKHGFDFVLKKELKGEYPDYGNSTFAREPSPLGTAEEIEKWSTTMHDLTKFRNVREVEELERELAILRGVIPDADGFDIAAIEAKFRKGKGPQSFESYDSSTVAASTDNDLEIDHLLDSKEFMKDLTEIQDELDMD